MKIIRTAAGSIVSWGFIKELQKLGIEVIGVDSDHNSYALKKLAGYVVPKANEADFLDVILDIIDIEEPDAIISGPEEELLVLAENREYFNEVMLLMPSYESLKICTDKLEMDKFLRQIDVPTPIIYVIELIKDYYMMKPRFGRGGKGIKKVSIEDILDKDLHLNDDYIFQEYIEGEEYSIDILADQEGNTLNIVPRLRMKVIDGKSVISKTVYDKEIIDYCRIIVKKLKLFGPSCIQCIKNNSGVYFIDINPRFGGGSILSIKADTTILPNLIRLINRVEPRPNDKFEEGLTMVRYYKEVFF